MATLEKIRSKSVLLLVIIGVALLAFIIGDALTNSRNLFGDHTTVAKIGGTKIDYTEYQRKREELNRRLEQARQQNPQQFANFDTQVLSEMALEELVGTTLLDQAADRAGFRSSPTLLRHYTLENPVNVQDLQEILRQLNQAGVSVTTPAQAYEVIFNPTRNGLTVAQMEPFQHAWVAMENETKKIIARNAYQRALFGAVKANDLDKKALYDDYVAVSTIEMAYRPYGQLDEKEYPVSASELSKAYDENKSEYKVNEPTKSVSFIAVRISPSAADRAASTALSKKTLAFLNDSTANGNLPSDLRKEGVVSQRREVRASDLTAGAVKNYVAEAAPGAVSVVREDGRGFTIVKMGRRSAEVDSIQIDLVQVAGSKLPAQVLARLNAGLSVDSLNNVFSADSVMAQSGQWIPLFAKEGRTNAIEKSQLESLRANPGQFVSLLSTDQGAVLAKIVKSSSPKEVYSFEELTYALNPSSKTVNDERTKLEKFLLANNTAKLFAQNAAKDGFNLQQYDFTQSTPAVPYMKGMTQYYPESRQVVRWVMIDGKPGEVSHVYENKDATAPMLYAVAVDSEFDDYQPLSSKEVTEALTAKVRRDKAGDALVKKYAGKNIADVAAKMSVEPRQVENVRLGRGSGVRDAKLLGRITGSKADKKLNVIKGDDGVYAYVISEQSKADFPYDESAYEQQYFMMVNPDLGAMLKGAAKYKNNAYQFEGGD